MNPSISLDSNASLIQSETAELSVELAATEMDGSVSLTLDKYGSYSPESPDDSYSPSMMTLLTNLAQMDEESIFYNNGYQKISKICDTLQGAMYKAIKLEKEVLNVNYNNKFQSKQSYVAIKQTNKSLFSEKIAIEDDDTTFCVSEDIIKEAMILKYLTVDNTPIGGYIVKYIDLFESDTDYFLVMEYIESEMNLKQFVSKSREYIKNGKLSANQYHKIVKYLLWQLFVTIQWLHSMHCMLFLSLYIFPSCTSPNISNNTNTRNETKHNTIYTKNTQAVIWIFVWKI